MLDAHGPGLVAELKARALELESLDPGTSDRSIAARRAARLTAAAIDATAEAELLATTDRQQAIHRAMEAAGALLVASSIWRDMG